MAKSYYDRRPLDVDREPWARQSWENSKHYNDFLAWKNMMPRDRTMLALSEERKISPTTAQNLAHRNDWKRRVEAWDDYVAEKREEVVLDEILQKQREMMKRHTINATEYQDLMSLELRRWIHQLGVYDEKPDTTAMPTLPIQEIMKGFDWAMNFERKTVGLPDATIATQSSTTVNMTFEREQFQQRVLSLPEETQQQLAKLLAPEDDSSTVDAEYTEVETDS